MWKQLVHGSAPALARAEEGHGLTVDPPGDHNCVQCRPVPPIFGFMPGAIALGTAGNPANERNALLPNPFCENDGRSAASIRNVDLMRGRLLAPSG